MSEKNAIIIISYPSKEGCEKTAKILLNEKLAACIQIHGPITSHYTWKGQSASEKEYQIQVKTRETLYQNIEKKILETHPYDCPEILLIPIQNGYTPYLTWIEETTKSAL